MMQHITAFIAQILAWLIDTDSPLDGAQLALITSTGEVAKDAVLGDLTQANFTGYALATVTYEVATAANGEKYLHHDPVDFTPTNATNLPQSITGVAVLDADDNLLSVGYFPDAILLTAADQHFHVTAPIHLDDQTVEITAEAALI